MGHYGPYYLTFIIVTFTLIAVELFNRTGDFSL